MALFNTVILLKSLTTYSQHIHATCLTPHFQIFTILLFLCCNKTALQAAITQIVRYESIFESQDRLKDQPQCALSVIPIFTAIIRIGRLVTQFSHTSLGRFGFVDVGAWCPPNQHCGLASELAAIYLYLNCSQKVLLTFSMDKSCSLNLVRNRYLLLKRVLYKR